MPCYLYENFAKKTYMRIYLCLNIICHDNSMNLPCLKHYFHMWILRNILGNCHVKALFPMRTFLHMWACHRPSTKICPGKKNVTTNNFHLIKPSMFFNLSYDFSALFWICHMIFFPEICPCYLTQRGHVTKTISSKKRSCLTNKKNAMFWFCHMIFLYHVFEFVIWFFSSSSEICHGAS